MEKLKSEIIEVLYRAREQRHISEDALEILLENVEKIFQEQSEQTTTL